MTLQWASSALGQNFVTVPVSFTITKTASGHNTGIQGSFTYMSGDVESPTDQDVLDVIKIMRDAYEAAGYTTDLRFEQTVFYSRSVEDV